MVRITKSTVTRDGHLNIRKVTFEASGLEKPKDWTYVKRGQFVAALVYNPRKECFLLVKQYRIPVWENREPPFILEVVAGMHDQMTHEDTLMKELKEELGEELRIEESIVEITEAGRFYTSPGLSCELGYAYYVVLETELTPVQFGGVEEEGEYVERIELSVEQTLSMLKQGLIIDAKTQLLLYWWLTNMADWETIQWYRSL